MLTDIRNMLTDIAYYISSCTACAQAKVPCALLASKLMPLPNPQCLWPDLVTDFITDLSEPNTNTVIMVIINHFSRSLCLIPLPSLPAAFQTAELIFYHVFRIDGILEGIVSE